MFAAYRADIDGLRAVSVGGVLLFHYGFAAFSGGFVGVDVFFVISGYLITRILVDQLDQGGISLLDFYDRRIRRIFPAALVAIAAALVVGFFLLLPGDYAELGRSAAYSAASLANVYFYQHTGYFDRQSDLLPLLHFWSLAVEEQFYLVWPALLALFVFLARGSRRTIAILVAGVIIASFAVSVYQVATDAKAAFYLPFARAWELALGAMLVFLPALRSDRLPGIGRALWVGELISLAGLALIALAIFSLSPQDPFPGAAALAPCIGAALLLWPKDRPTLTGRLLSLPPLRFVGQISYSLYLWHWPTLVFYRTYINGAMPSTTQAVALAFVSFVLAWLSWRFVEQPFRRRLLSPARTIAAGLGVTCVVVAAGTALASEDGFPGRLPASVYPLRSLEAMWEWPCEGRFKSKEFQYVKSYCNFGMPWETARNKGFLWGDSHVEHFAPLFEVLAKDFDASFILYRSCSAILGRNVKSKWKKREDYEERCTKTQQEALSFLRDRPDINYVILASAWTNSLNQLYTDDPSTASRQNGLELLKATLIKLITEISSSRRHIVLVGDVPQWAGGGDPIPCTIASSVSIVRQPCTPREPTITRAAFEAYQRTTYDVFRALAAQFPDVDIVLPGEAMCKGDNCLTYLDNEFLYRDGSHLRRNIAVQTRRDLAKLIGLDTVFSTNYGHADK